MVSLETADGTESPERTSDTKIFRNKLLTNRDSLSHMWTSGTLKLLTMIIKYFLQVNMAPETPLNLDQYYNGLKSINKRKYSYTEKPKSFKQSLKDMFFPQVRNPSRKIVKVKKPNPYSSTLKPFNFKFPSQKKTEDLFPYKFLKPIQNPNYRYIEEVPRSTIAKTIDIENKIDKQLVSPTDPEVNLQGKGQPKEFLSNFISEIINFS